MRVAWKSGRLTPAFSETITLLNKLDAKDSTSGMDEWKSTVLHDCAWSEKAVRSVQGNVVSVGRSIIVRIPASPDFRPYSEWKDGMDGFTLSTGDCIIHEEVTETVTPDNVKQVLADHEGFVVKSAKINTAIPSLAHYLAEGV